MHFRGSGSAVRFELCGGVDVWQRVVIQTMLWLGPDGGSGLGPDGKTPLGSLLDWSGLCSWLVRTSTI